MYRLSALAAAAIAALLSTAPGAAAQPSHCPPGLAKKNPPCVPPGLAGRGGRDDGRDLGDSYDEGYRDGYRDGLRVGDRLHDGSYRLIRDPGLYRLDPYRSGDWRYYLVRDLIVQADPETLEVLAVIGLASALLD